MTKFLIFLSAFLFTGLCLADKCKIDKESWCVFSSVHTTQYNSLFKPTADNPNNVEKVKFISSNIHTLTNEICNVFPNLKNLEMDKVGLEKINSNALNNCTKIIEVSLWTNELTEVPQDIFKNNLLLETLTLQHNKLNEINPLIFENLKYLKTLSVNENYLIEFPVYKMPRILTLKSLWIHHNDLTDLDEKEIIYKFPNLKTIYMEDNPFNCDRLKVILAAFQRNNITVDRWHDIPRDRKYKLTTVDTVDCLSKEEQENYVIKDKIAVFKEQLDDIKLEIENFQSSKKAIETLKHDVQMIKSSRVNTTTLVVFMVLTVLGVLLVGAFIIYRRKKGLYGFKFGHVREDVEFTSNSANILCN